MRHFLIFLFVFIFCSCGPTEKKCKYSAPTAIFSKDISAVVTHQFQSKDQVATESATFENGLNLELEQSGCDNIKQVFQLKIERPGEGEPNWFLIVADQFNYLSSLSEQTMSLAMWATVISTNASLFKLGLPVEVEQGFFVKIDKIDSGKDAILIVELSQNTPSSNPQ